MVGVCMWWLLLCDIKLFKFVVKSIWLEKVNNGSGGMDMVDM